MYVVPPIPGSTKPANDTYAFAEALGHLVAEGGRSLRQISADLARQGTPIALGTLSSWLNKQSRPPRSDIAFRRVRALERLLGAPFGTLVEPWLEGRLRQSTQKYPPTVPPPGAGDEPTGGDVSLRRRTEWLEQHIKQAGGGDSRAGLIVTSAMEHYRVGSDRFPRGSRITLTLSALRPGIRSYWYRHCHDWDEYRPVVTPVENCRVGTLLTEESYRQVPPGQEAEILVVAELLLDEPLIPYRPYQISYRVSRSYPANASTRTAGMFRRAATGANCEQLSISVAFDGSPPSKLLCQYWPEEECDEGMTPKNTRLTTDLHDELELRNPPAGLYGWKWKWNDSPSKAGGAT